MKKIVLILFIQLFPLCCLADGYIQANQSGVCGESCHWEVNNGTLTISGTGTMYDYSYSSGSTNAPWYNMNSQITNIVIEKGITHIGVNAFLNTNALNVSLPNTLTSIGASAFHNTKLTDVIVPSSVERVGYNAFANTPLQNLTISDKTVFEQYEFNSSIGFLTGVDLNNLHIYCSGVSHKCDQNLTNGGYNLSTMQLQRKRIYTVEEAARISKKTGNTFKLRYK